MKNVGYSLERTVGNLAKEESRKNLKTLALGCHAKLLQNKDKWVSDAPGKPKKLLSPESPLPPDFMTSSTSPRTMEIEEAKSPPSHSIEIKKQQISTTSDKISSESITRETGEIISPGNVNNRGLRVPLPAKPPGLSSFTSSSKPGETLRSHGTDRGER